MILIYGKGKVGTNISKLLNYLNIPHHILDDENNVDIENYDIIIPSPGIKPSHKIYKYKEKIIGELDLIHNILKKLKYKEDNFFYTNGINKLYFIGITGTDGKSTTTWKIYNVLKNNKKNKIFIGGNFNKPLSELFLNFLKNPYKNNIFVLEISSFMAYNLKKLKFIGSYWTNFDYDHLDWHKNLEEYFESKKKLLNLSKIKYPKYIKKSNFFKNDNLKFFIENIIEELNINLKINLDNIPSLPHRFEYIGQIDGIRIIDDSKCTTRNCLEFAINRLDGPTILISGGYDKGINYQGLEKILKEKIIFGIIFGDIKYKLSKIFEKAGIEYKIYNDFEEAIKDSLKIAKFLKAKNILFSPGASSFDMFSNREERAKKFLEIIKIKKI